MFDNAMNSNTKKLRIVLFEWRPVKSLFRWESLGIQYITSKLRQAGYQVEVFVFEDEPMDSLCDKVLSYEPDIVGVPIYQETFNVLTEVLRRLKSMNPNLLIMVGGHTASLYASRILINQPVIDIAVVGEGEEAVLELCNCIEDKMSLDSCLGIQYRKGNLIYRNKSRSPIEDLDKLPFPALDILERATIDAQESVLVSISTSRGCLGNCSFCVEHRVSKKPGIPGWKGRSCENIIAEIDFLAKRFSNKRLVIHFIDGSFEDSESPNKERLTKMMALLKEKEYPIAFSFLTRSESWNQQDQNLIKDMRSLGLYSVSVGFESGSDSTLKVFHKRARSEDHKRMATLFSKNDVNVAGFIIMYHPYATFEGLKESTNFLRDLKATHRPEVWFHDLIVYPDTRIFRQVVDDGLLLGPDANGFTYRYAFEDGRVFALYELMREFKNLKGIMQFQTSFEKVNFEIMLYGVWKEKIAGMKAVAETMKTYSENVHQILQTVGDWQHSLFLELIEAAEKERLDAVKDNIKTKWDQITSENQAQLEKLWLKNKMELGRQKIKIV